MIQPETQSIRLNSALQPASLGLRPNPEGKGLQLYRASDQTVLGTVQQETASPLQVEIYEGKGGLTAILTSPQGLKYFALPGADIEVSGTRIHLAGDPIEATPGKTRHPLTRQHQQSETPQAMILGAGLATRFEPVSGDNTQYAKPSVPLAGDQSVIQCIAHALARDNFTQLIVNTYYKPESLKDSLSRASQSSVRYIDEAQPSGTAGGIRKILEDPQYQALLDRNKPILIVQGDAVTDANFSDLMAAHLANNAAITIGCQVVPDAQVHQVGIVATDQSGSDSQSGRVTQFKEKPSLADAGPHRLGNAGFYLFAPEAYTLILEVFHQKQQETGEVEPLLDFANDIFPAALAATQAGKLKNAQGQPMSLWAQVVEGYWSDIGNPAQYLQSVHDIYAGYVDLPMPQQPQDFYENGVLYWPGAKAKARSEGAKLSGNVIVALPFGIH